MDEVGLSRLTQQELEQRLRRADPGVALVPTRILRRVLWHLHSSEFHGFAILRCRNYSLSRRRLFDIVDREELNGQAEGLPDKVILLARPGDEELATHPAPEVLLRYWRLLFQSRVKLALEGVLTVEEEADQDPNLDKEMQRRIQAIGRAEWEEIRTVLRDEGHMFARHDPRSAYAQFGAVFLEYLYFAPKLLPVYFPAVCQRGDIVNQLLAETDADALIDRIRPEGAPDPLRYGLEGLHRLPKAPTLPGEASLLPPAEYQKLVARARRAAAKGNHVRAAVIYARAAGDLWGPEAVEAQTGAEESLGRLADGLAAVKPLGPIDRRDWYDALLPLLRPAASGYWSVAARLLYDLQRVCIDRRQGIYAIDLLKWAFSLGRVPLKRPVDAHRKVLLLKHLRRARRRLTQPGVRRPPGTAAADLGLSESQAERLDALLRLALHGAEGHTRKYFRPKLDRTLRRVGLAAANLPEEVARDKLRGELLDRIVERGTLTMGDVRDGIARNQLKLPDLSGPGELVFGDQLLRLNNELGRSLDGVYRRGDFYLRWLQTFTSLAYGTAVGRWLTRWVAVPFGGAFVAIKGVYYIGKEIGHFFPGPDAPHSGGVVPPWTLTPFEGLMTVMVGVFLLLTLNSRDFRAAVFRLLRGVGRVLRFVLIDLPVWIPRLPVVHSVVNSPPLRFARRHLLWPAAVAAAVYGLLRLRGVAPEANLQLSGAVFGLATAFLATRLGRTVSEVFTERLVDLGHHLSFRVVPAAFQAVMDGFKELVNAVEQYMYDVDEKLRFKGTEGTVSLAVKSVLGVFWNLISYVTRFLIVLIIEPTVNPIKHFPVVTVAGKFMLVLLGILPEYFTPLMGKWLSGLLTTAIVFGSPGVFGFLVWELKTNWRLYRANRPEHLEPVRVGHHGETVLQLLRPGLHSGTVPRQFARWRSAERRGRVRSAFKAQQRLEQIEESVRHFVDREFVNLLRKSRPAGGLELTTCHAQLTLQRIEVHVCRAGRNADPLRVHLELRSGLLVARVGKAPADGGGKAAARHADGWLADAAGPERAAVQFALLGLFRLAGVAVVEEQLLTVLGIPGSAYDFRNRKLIVWPKGKFHRRLVYDLQNPVALPPEVIPEAPGKEFPALDPDEVFLDRQPLKWADWVAFWEGAPAARPAEPAAEPVAAGSPRQTA